MYYKISDKSSPIYRQLRDIRANELILEAQNRNVIELVIGFPITAFVGVKGQAAEGRVTIYTGFLFPEGSTPPPEIWSPINSRFNGYYGPNLRTCQGRRMATFLGNLDKSLSNADMLKLCRVANPDLQGNSVPEVFLCDNMILLHLDDRLTPDLPEAHVITLKEFHHLLRHHGIEGSVAKAEPDRQNDI